MKRLAMILLVPLLLALVLGYIGVAAFLAYNQQRFILPARVNSVSAPDVALNYAYTTLTTPEGETLQGILFLPADETKRPVTELVLAFAGNTHNPIGFAEFLKTQVYAGRKDVVIAAFSYRGYPNGLTPPSSGTPSQAAMYADAEFIYDQLNARFQPQQIKVVGYSIGTAVAAHLATERKIDAMALVAPIASVRRIVQARYPWLPIRLLLRHPFATEDIIADIQTPTTLIYSPTDGLVPVDHVTQVLHGKNPSIPLVPVEHTNHVSLAMSPPLPGLLQQALGLTR
ncbi:MAG: alpha/beta hydrolase [Blastochloris viridis]|uniref:Alpha/beta hydrolase n=1 Tax=Blastochloris viridis TaxID=1079 RepID=A0A6N4QXM4_BLAVI|nr:MAG: alpha/beta hydrolase [Blastochloris viridis]